MLAWVSLLRGLPFQSASALRPPGPPALPSSPEPSFLTKLLWLAHLDQGAVHREVLATKQARRSANCITSVKKLSTISCSSSRSRFFEKVE